MLTISRSAIAASRAATSSAVRARVKRASRGNSRRLSYNRFERAEIEFAVAPLQQFDAVEVVALEPLDQIGVERFGAARHAEGAVVHIAPGAAGNLADFAGRQIAVVLAIEFAGCGKRDVIDIEVQPMPMASVATINSTSPD